MKQSTTRKIKILVPKAERKLYIFLKHTWRALVLHRSQQIWISWHSPRLNLLPHCNNVFSVSREEEGGGNR